MTKKLSLSKFVAVKTKQDFLVCLEQTINLFDTVMEEILSEGLNDRVEKALPRNIQILINKSNRAVLDSETLKTLILNNSWEAASNLLTNLQTVALDLAGAMKSNTTVATNFVKVDEALRLCQRAIKERNPDIIKNGTASLPTDKDAAFNKAANAEEYVGPFVDRRAEGNIPPRHGVSVKPVDPTIPTKTWGE